MSWKTHTPKEWKTLLRAKNVKAIQALHDFLDQFKDEQGNYGYGSHERATKIFGVSRGSIYNIIKKYPNPRQRASKDMQPAFVSDFEKSPIVKKIREVKNKPREAGGTRADDIIRTGRQAWLILNRKAPISWDYNDYKLLWAHERFRDKKTGVIAFRHTTALRAFMEFAKLYDLKNSEEFNTKGTKREKGQKKTEYIQTEKQLIDVVNAIKYPDTLIMFNLGIQCGARISSLKHTTPAQIDYQADAINMIEPKLKHTGKESVTRYFIKKTLQVTREYIIHFDVGRQERLFKRSNPAINKDLKQAGVKAGLDFDLTSHVAMKHTFVSFASNHGVSLEIVALQAHTDAQTLMDFYAGIGKAKISYELLGQAKMKAPDYAAVMERLQPVVRARFELIKNAFDKSTKKTKKTAKGKQKRKLNWAAIKGMANSTETPKHLQATWKKAYALHKAGKTDTQVRKEMGWK